MTKTKSIKTSGLPIRLFASLMIVTALGVLFKYPILIPLQLFFMRATTYTSSQYSYKPGQVGWTYDFFVMNDAGLYVEVGLIIVMVIAFLFYVGFFSGISTILQLTKRQFKEAKRDAIITVFTAFCLFGLPQIVALDSLFKINKKGLYGIIDRVYTPQNGTWEIAQQKLNGFLIKDHKIISTDSCFLIINKITDEGTHPFFSEKLGFNSLGFETRMFGDTLWIFQEQKDYIKAFNSTTEALLVENINDVIKLDPTAEPKQVLSFRGPDVSARKNCLYLTMNNGSILYFLLERSTIQENQPFVTKLNEKYRLKRLNKHRSQLITNKREVNWEDNVFLEAAILGYTDDFILIRHKPNISKETKHLITAYGIENGNTLWQIDEATIPFLGKIYGRTKVNAFIDAPLVRLNFKDAFSLKGTCSVDAKGKVSMNEGTPDIMQR